MTLVEENKKLNELIRNRRIEYTSDKTSYVDELNGDTITRTYATCDKPFKRSLERELDRLSSNARSAYFIQKLLDAIGIQIDNIETEYNRIICSLDCFIIFYLKKGNTYTFIELWGRQDTHYGDSFDSLTVTKLDLDSTAFIYDRIDIKESKHYHADSKISDYTLAVIDQIWSKKEHIGQNDYYNVVAQDSPKNPKKPWVALGQRCVVDSNYGEYISDLDIDKLDKSVCMVKVDDNNKPQKIYYR